MANESKSTKYLLLESTCLDCVLTPLQTTQRIKYTCFDVSENFIVFGATSGGIYIFSRDPCHFLQLLPNKDGSLNNVSISPDERFIGFSTCRGIAVILERSTEGGSYLVSRSEEHSGSNITSLTWSDNSNQLYVADNTGQLSLINISLFINKSIFQLPSHIIIKLDSEIVQVSCCGELLLVSTQTRSYVCDTVKEQYKQVGTKLREGVFGASFIKYSDGIVKAFCARPGSRLWEVDTEGSVLCTHQFKQAVTSGPSVLVSLPDNKIHKNEFLPWQDQSINFPYLFPVMNKYLFSFKQDSFYIFDPEKVEFIVECNKYSDVVDARCVGNRIYTWNSKGSIREFTLTPVENCLINLYFRGAYSLCVEICETFVEYIEQLESNKLFMMSPLLGLSHHIDNLHLNYNLSSFFVNLNNCCNSKTFKFNLNYSLESSAKIPKDCDKSDTIFSCNNLISKTSNLVIDDSSCYCSDKTNEGFHSNCSDNKKNIITNHDNNVHNNGYLVESSSPYCSSDTSNSPDVSLACLSPSDTSASSVQLSKFNSETAKYKTKFIAKKLDTFKDQLKPTMNGLNKVKYSLDPKDAAFSNLSDTDDSVVVEGREVKKRNGTRMPTIDLSRVINICDTISKSDNSCKVELFAQFLHHLYLIYKEYKTFSSNDKNYQRCFNFPLSKYLNEESSKEMEQCFYDVIYSGELVDCLKLLPDEFNKLPDTNVIYPEKVLSFYSESELQLDIRLSNLFFLIIDILNPFIILQLLDSVNLPCCFLSWNSVLSSYQDHSFDITIAQELHTFSHWPLPVILNIIFLMLRLDQVESASYISKQVNISIKDACYLNFRLYSHLDPSDSDDKSNNQTNKLFITYLASLINDREEEVKGLNSETVRYIEDMLMQVCNAVVCDNCNFPIVTADSLVEEGLLGTVGDLLLNYYMKYKTTPCCESEPPQDKTDLQTDSPRDTLTDELCSLSKSLAKILPLDIIDKVTDLVKILPNIILKLIESNYCEVVNNLEFIAQFNLLQYLESYTSGLNSHQWISLCEYYKELSEGFCCICHHDQSSPRSLVQWNTLASLMLQALGPAISIQILLNYSAFIPPGELYLSFYRSTLLSHVLSQNTDEITYKDVLKSYHQQFVKEPIDSQLSQIGVVSMWEGDSNETAPSIVQSKDKKHWGITLDINDDVCSKCSVVLNSQVLLADGLRSFKCGHTYHVICLRLSNSLFQCSICS